MRANIVFKSEFFVPTPAGLPHARGEGDPDIFGDWTEVADNFLWIRSNTGEMMIPGWCTTEIPAGWKVQAGTPAVYEGAYHAMFAVAGIEFPKAKVTNIESTFGQFPTLEEYEAYRRAIGWDYAPGGRKAQMEALGKFIKHEPDLTPLGKVLLKAAQVFAAAVTNNSPYYGEFIFGGRDNLPAGLKIVQWEEVEG